MLKTFLNGIMICAVFSHAFAQTLSPQTKPQSSPQIERRPLGTQQRDTNQAPPQPGLTPQQITQAIKDGIATAAKQYEKLIIPPQPPDNSGWWFNLFMVAFTGCLVLVGAAAWQFPADSSVMRAREV
jgi:hypothetical protein